SSPRRAHFLLQTVRQLILEQSPPPYPAISASAKPFYPLYLTFLCSFNFIIPYFCYLKNRFVLHNRLHSTNSTSASSCIFSLVFFRKNECLFINNWSL